MITVDVSNVWGEITLPDLVGVEQEVSAAHALLSERTGVRCNVADDAASCVVYGCGKSLAWINQMTEGPINVARKRLLGNKHR